MQQNELARLLDISPAMVSRLVKRGMPSDTLERAQRWRKRHLEPGRMKGNRFSPDHEGSKKSLSDANVAPAVPNVSFFEIEAAGALVDAALIRGNYYGAAIRTWQVRGLLRSAGGESTPRLSLRVWLALIGYTVHEDAEILKATEQGQLLTPESMGTLVCPKNPWAAHTVLYEACDWDDVALNGWPEGYADD